MVRRRETTSNVEAITQTITTLRGDGRLLPEHEALVQACRSLARDLDGAVKASEAGTLWREYRQLLEMLLRVGDGGSDDDTAAFLVSIQTPGVRSKVRNAAKP
jgi:hypothetical protein